VYTNGTPLQPTSVRRAWLALSFERLPLSKYQAGASSRQGQAPILVFTVMCVRAPTSRLSLRCHLACAMALRSPMMVSCARRPQTVQPRAPLRRSSLPSAPGPRLRGARRSGTGSAFGGRFPRYGRGGADNAPNGSRRNGRAHGGGSGGRGDGAAEGCQMLGWLLRFARRISWENSTTFSL
jgi:hypothetical protein